MFRKSQRYIMIILSLVIVITGNIQVFAERGISSREEIYEITREEWLALDDGDLESNYGVYLEKKSDQAGEIELDDLNENRNLQIILPDGVTFSLVNSFKNEGELRIEFDSFLVKDLKNEEPGIIYNQGKLDLYGQNLSFIANESKYGGAIYNRSQIDIDIKGDIKFMSNRSENGGAIYSRDDDLGDIFKIKGKNVLFKDNYSDGNGGAIVLESRGETSILASDNVSFINNKSKLTSGAISNKRHQHGKKGSLTISGSNVEFLNNESLYAGLSGGAIDNDSNLKIRAKSRTSNDKASILFMENKANASNTTEAGAIMNYGLLDLETDGDIYFIRNSSGLGAAIYNRHLERTDLDQQGISLRAKNIIFLNNTGKYAGGSIFNQTAINTDGNLAVLGSVGGIRFKLNSNDKERSLEDLIIRHNGEQILDGKEYNKNIYENMKIISNYGTAVYLDSQDVPNMKMPIIKYDPNGGHWNSSNDIRSLEDMNPKLDGWLQIVYEEIEDPEREGYRFKGWKSEISQEKLEKIIEALNDVSLYNRNRKSYEDIKENLTYIAESEALGRILLKEELIFKAIWEKEGDEKEYIVEYVDRVGSNKLDSLNLKAGSKIKLPKLSRNRFTKEGIEYIFKGWKENTVDFYIGQEIEVNRDRRFIAVWDEREIEEEEVPPIIPPIDPPKKPEEPKEPEKPEEPKEPEKPKKDRDDWIPFDYIRPKGTIEPEKAEEIIQYEINRKDHYWYIKGYPEGDVRPNGSLTREEFAAMITRTINKDFLEAIDSSKVENKFTDVGENRWSEKYISILSSLGILEGYGDNTFRPGENITRAEMAKIIFYLNGLEEVEDSSILDIDGHWAEDYIKSLADENWIEGYLDKTFKPDENISRAEAVQMLNNMLYRDSRLENMLDGRLEFTDLNKDHKSKWYYEAFQEAINSHKYKIKEDIEYWTELEENKAHW